MTPLSRLLLAAMAIPLVLAVWLFWGDNSGSRTPPVSRQQRLLQIERQARSAILRANCQNAAGTRPGSVSQLTLELEVDAEGHAHTAVMEVAREAGSFEEMAPEVSECVANAVERERYPRGPAMRLRLPAQ